MAAVFGVLGFILLSMSYRTLLNKTNHLFQIKILMFLPINLQKSINSIYYQENLQIDFIFVKAKGYFKDLK